MALSPVQARAHAHLIKSVPAASSEVSRPHELVLTYTEALEPTLVKVVVSSGSKPVAGTGEPEITASGKGLRVRLPPLTAGTYTVEWEIVSKDGHRTKGSLEFKVK
jgi:methionine-rich copper-binding protein CopC